MNASPKKPMTHIAWAQHFRHGKFRAWVEVGNGRIDVDGSGKATAHVYYDRTVIGDNGYTCLLPIGEKPPMPSPQAIPSPRDPGENEEN